MVIAFTWAWDSSELLYKARTLLDKVSFAVLLSTGVVLFFFNAFLQAYRVHARGDRRESQRRAMVLLHDLLSSSAQGEGHLPVGP